MLIRALIISAVIAAKLAAAEPPVYGSYRFVQDVLLGIEHGTNVKRCRRFIDSPSVALLSGHEHEKEFVDAVASVNEALAPTRFSLRTMFPTSAEAQMKCFYAASPADYTRIRQSYGLQAAPDNFAWWMYWDEISRIKNGLVLMNIERCDGDTIRYRTTRGLLGALGFPGSSSEVEDSIFSGHRTTLTPTDRHLIQFFYSHVRPDAQAWELRNMFDQFWSK